MNILIVKLSAIGDVIHTLPALNAIRRRFPRAVIHWVVEEAAADLVIGHEALDRVLVSGRKRWLKGMRTPARQQHLREAAAFVRALRETRYDMVFDFQALLKSAMVVTLARADRKIGFGPGLSHMEHSYWFLNERIPAVSMEMHALDRGLHLLSAVGIPTDTVDYRLPVGAADRRAAATLIAETGNRGAGPLIAINPVAKWPTKLWRNDRFAELADRLIAKRDARIVFTGGREDRETVADIRNRMDGESVDATGRTTLKSLAALYAAARAVISTDTGPMHLAAAVETPVVALFGPTAPWRTGPYGAGHHVVTAPIACAPCFKRTCDCRPGCMERIDLEQVWAAVETVLDPDY